MHVGRPSSWHLREEEVPAEYLVAHARRQRRPTRDDIMDAYEEGSAGSLMCEPIMYLYTQSGTGVGEFIDWRAAQRWGIVPNPERRVLPYSSQYPSLPIPNGWDII